MRTAGCRARLMSTYSLAPPLMERRGDSERLIQLLSDKFGDKQVVTNRNILLQHATDESLHDPTNVLPDVVFYPKDVEQVSEAMKMAKACDSPVIPFGAGTSLEGHVAALQGGLTLDFREHMNKILTVNAEDMDCTVQAGCTRGELNSELRYSGLHFPVDPGADATIGGMVSTSASGTTAVKYGTMKSQVLGLTFVLEDGTIVQSGGRARKSSSGYDLSSLVVGSEGTLACITDVTLRLYGQPEAVSSTVCSFDSVGGAVSSVVTALQYGLPMARAEFLDSVSMGAIAKRCPEIGLQTDKPALFLEFQGTEQGVKEQTEIMREICAENGLVGDFEFATAEEDRHRLWKARHEAYYAALSLRPGSRGIPTDVCVPISNLTECIEETVRDIETTGIIAPLMGHVGDGNFHLIMLSRPEGEEDPAYLDKIYQVNDRLVQRAIDMEGTCTGEHGIGYGKLKWLEKEHGPGAMHMMRLIKQSVDPTNRMNPGKAII